LREVFADHAAAVREYQEIDAGAGGIADDAAFFLAVSLESDGRTQEAADAYRRYLKRAAPTHAAAARTRLAALAR
jgi:predicted TPR repeat methyltransferase